MVVVAFLHPTMITTTPCTTSCRSEWVLRKLRIPYDRNTMTRDEGYAAVEKNTDVPVYLILDLHFTFHIPFTTIMNLNRKEASQLFYQLRNATNSDDSNATVPNPQSAAQRPMCIDSIDDEEEPEKEATEKEVDDKKQYADAPETAHNTAAGTGIKGVKGGRGNKGAAT